MDEADRPRPETVKDAADQAAELLEQALRALDSNPSEPLKLLFREAADLQFRLDPGLISTERLLMAIVVRAETIENEPLRDPEASAVIAAARVALRDLDRFTDMAKELAALPGAEPQPPSIPLSLSSNVQRVLADAARHRATMRPNGPPAVDLGDFLTVFPPKGSKAEELLLRVGIQPSEMSEAANAGYRGFMPPDPRQTSASADPSPPPGQPQKAPKKRAPRPKRAVNDRVFTHSDEPAEVDQLGREPFAEVLARRIREARESGGPDGPAAFIVHLHGSWGSGKSTVLNFLEAKLAAGSEPWLVVRFNAWRNQRLQPPWWSLITTIYRGARSALNWRQALRLRLRWLFWRIRADYVPLIAVAACGLALLAVVLWVGDPGTAIAPGNSAGPPPTRHEEQLANWLDRLLKLVAAGITIVGAIVLWSRSLAMGSQRAAQAYADIKSDPYRPIARLFDRLVEAIDQPVVVFVDDLDRCESKYVVDLLEGIQTLLRGAPVTYVVAGDRKWICSSFEQRYGAFSPPIGEPGRPLGYLFLDKIFQISAAMPQPGAEAQLSYWKRLLDPASADPEKQHAERRDAEAKADADAARLTRQEDLQKLVNEAERSGDEAVIQATRAAAAKRIASQPAAAETEHRLKDYVGLLEPNPRAMKRLVNAYGMHQATLFLAGRSCPPDALARWTILELRWPLLADFLATRPGCVDRLHAALGEGDLPQVPGTLRDLFGDELVIAVIGPEGGRRRLSAAAIRSILGAVEGDR